MSPPAKAPPARLRVGFVSGILNPRYGGPPFVLRGHLGALGARVGARVFGVSDPGDEAELRALYPGCELYPKAFPGRWFRGRGLRAGLAAAAPDLDVLHVHMLWDHTVWATAQVARQAGLPFVVSPHGNILNVGRLWPPHKALYRDLVLGPLLGPGAVIHALNAAEAEACVRFGVRCPIRIVPNGLPAGDYALRREPAEALEAWPVLRGRRVLLFVGRLARQKGLDLLVEAWARRMRRTGADDWVLVIAGHDYRGTAGRIARLVRERGLEGSVALPGPVQGDLKHALYGCAQAFVLPSRTEGFSLALLEALAASLPCVYTTGCHFPELAAAGGGWEVEADPGALDGALSQALALSPARLRAMGRLGNALGRRDYSLEAVADGLLRLYREAAGV